MKKIRNFFIGIVLITLVIILIGTIYFINKLSFTVANIYPEFSYMRVPMLLLVILVILSIISALLFGINALILFNSDKIFIEKMRVCLENIGVSFFIASIGTFLMIIYTDFNLDGSITNLPISLAMVFFILISQIFFLLRDLICEGIEIKKENDLTI